MIYVKVPAFCVALAPKKVFPDVSSNIQRSLCAAGSITVTAVPDGWETTASLTDVTSASSGTSGSSDPPTAVSSPSVAGASVSGGSVSFSGASFSFTADSALSADAASENCPAIIYVFPS